MNTGVPDTAEGSLLSPASHRSPGSPLEFLAEQPLITEARSSKLELLIYLIANLKSPLIVSGPLGIGKTRVLHMVEDRCWVGWTACFMETADRPDLAQIKQRMSAAADGAMGIESKAGLGRWLSAFAAKNRQLVILIDNAANIPGGLLDALYHFANKHSALRLVLAMTREELDIRKKTDSMLAKFHIVEIPSLNDEQCREFLQGIFAAYSRPEPQEAISNTLAAKIFRSTQGIPGRVVSTLPQIEALKAQDRKSRQLMTYGGISVGVIVTAVLLVLMNTLTGEDGQDKDQLRVASRQINQVVDQPTARSRRASIEANSEAQRPPGSSGKFNRSSEYRVVDSRVSKPDADPSGKARPHRDNELPSAGSKPWGNRIADRRITKLDAADNLNRPNAAVALSDASESRPVKSIEVADQSVLENLRKSNLATQGKKGKNRADQQAGMAAKQQNSDDSLQQKEILPTVEIESVASKFASAGLKSEDWLLGKNANDYTLQIMAAKKPDRLIAFAAQHPELMDLAYFRTRKNGSKWLAMVYGTFTSFTEANRATKKLPASLGRPWTRTFREIHQKIHSAQRN